MRQVQTVKEKSASCQYTKSAVSWKKQKNYGVIILTFYSIIYNINALRTYT